jgi:hypothetical protein
MYIHLLNLTLHCPLEVKKAREALAGCREVTEIVSNLEKVPVYMQGIKATSSVLSVIPRQSSLALHAEEGLYSVMSTVHQVLVDKHLQGASVKFDYEPYMPVFNQALEPDQEVDVDFTELKYDRMGVEAVDLGRLYFDVVELVEMDTANGKTAAELELCRSSIQSAMKGEVDHHVPFDHTNVKVGLASSTSPFYPVHCLTSASPSPHMRLPSPHMRLPSPHLRLPSPHMRLFFFYKACLTIEDAMESFVVQQPDEDHWPDGYRPNQRHLSEEEKAQRRATAARAKVKEVEKAEGGEEAKAEAKGGSGIMAVGLGAALAAGREDGDDDDVDSDGESEGKEAAPTFITEAKDDRKGAGADTQGERSEAKGGEAEAKGGEEWKGGG